VIRPHPSPTRAFRHGSPTLDSQARDTAFNDPVPLCGMRSRARWAPCSDLPDSWRRALPELGAPFSYPERTLAASRRRRVLKRYAELRSACFGISLLQAIVTLIGAGPYDRITSGCFLAHSQRPPPDNLRPRPRPRATLAFMASCLLRSHEAAAETASCADARTGALGRCGGGGVGGGGGEDGAEIQHPLMSDATREAKSATIPAAIKVLLADAAGT